MSDKLTSLTENVVKLVNETTDDVLAHVVVGGTMLGFFMGVSIPIELAGGILAFYFLRKKM